MEKQSITLNCFYKKNEDSLNVNFKVNSINSNFFKIHTFFSVVNLKIDKKDNKQSKVNSVVNDNIFYNVFNINNLSKIQNGKEKFTIKLIIHIKICFIQTTIMNYILYNFNTFYNNESISKISKSDMQLFLKNKYLSKTIEDQLLISLMHWCKHILLTIRF